MCRVHARVHACVCALCMFTHIGTAAYCTTVLLSTLRVSLCTRLHVHGNRGRGERKADARGVGGEGGGAEKGDTDKVSLRLVRITRRKRGRNRGGERGMGRGQRKARILSMYRRYPIKVPFLYTINVLRVTCMDDEIGPISILVSLRG